MDDLPTITALARAAAAGDEQAWNAIVQRYIPLVFSVIRRFHLTPADAQDASQALWLRLVEHLADVRDAQALPGWIAVTTKNETLRLLKARSRSTPIDPQTVGEYAGRSDSSELDEDLLRSERRQMLREALAELPAHQRELLLLLVADPPLSYREISGRLNIPIGSIGPTRARYLDRLRATPAMQAYFATESGTSGMGRD